MQKGDYILIIGVIPTKKNEKDGMIQRELAIDSLLSDVNRIYVDRVRNSKISSCIKNLKKHIEFKYNALDSFKNKCIKVYHCLDKIAFYKLCKKAKYIYCHSLYMLDKLPEEYIKEFKNKIIIDIHGCAVEEVEFNGCDSSIVSNFQKLEQFAFNNVKALVAVSGSMIDFYKSKYPGIGTHFIKLPIFSHNISKKVASNSSRLKIVYSGGAQKWQNVDLMIDAISKIADKFDIQILSVDIDIFKEKLDKYNLIKKVELKTVPYSEIKKEYVKADLGFVLRDDIIVNRVACPTKIIEYLAFGIIPVVVQPAIGDFDSLGYSYILNNDLINGKIPDRQAFREMVDNNFAVLNKLNAIQNSGVKELVTLIKDEG